MSALCHLPNIVLFSISIETLLILSFGNTFFCLFVVFSFFFFFLMKYVFLTARQALGHLENLSLIVLSFSDLKVEVSKSHDVSTWHLF